MSRRIHPLLARLIERRREQRLTQTVIAWHRWIGGPRPACSCGWTAEQPGDTHASHVIARIELDYYRRLRPDLDPS